MMTFFTQKVKDQLHCDIIKKRKGHNILFGPQGTCLHFLSLNDDQDRRSPVPLVVHHKLIGFADIELQMIVVAPCDKALYQSSVLQ